VIENAKKYAKDQKRSVSKLVEEYLSSLASSTDKGIEYDTLGPITKELVGIIKVNGHRDYKDILTDALMEKSNAHLVNLLTGSSARKRNWR
jgi:major membrane immunogen (membrane-anchored lipoprotein)